MSQKNVETVRRVYDGVTARLETPREFFGPDYEVDATETTAAGVLQGIDAADEVLGEYWRTFEDFRVQLEQVTHADEHQVVTAVRDGGKMRGSDAEVWNRFFHVWTFREGTIARLSIHTDRDRALEAAGLSE
jgi:ketosteroid isomerase-like protein